MYHFMTFMESGLTSKTFDFQRMFNGLVTEGIDFLKNLIIAILIILIGKKLIHMVTKALEKYFNRTKVEVSVAGFLIALIRALLYIIMVVVIVTQVLGIAKTSLVAIIGSAGLSIGLALQGSLSNFAGGILILVLKPYKVGDYIITGTNEGTVTAIDIFYTKLLTIDNRMLVMPNGALSNANIINATHEPIRRLDLFVSIDYSENIKKVKDLLFNIVRERDMVLKDKDITIFVNSFDTSAINIGVRAWVAKENYWILKCELLELIKNEFDKNLITIPFDQLDVNIRNNS